MNTRELARRRKHCGSLGNFCDVTLLTGIQRSHYGRRGCQGSTVVVVSAPRLDGINLCRA